MDQYYTVVAYVLAGLFGLCIGSFLNVAIYRIPNGMSVAKPASHCPQCGYVLHWYDNIPVLSYLMLGGKCRKCRQHISMRYTLVELANTVLYLLCVWLFWQKSPVFALIAAISCSVLICIFFIDLEHMLIFDRFTITLAALGVLATVFDPDTVWWGHLIGAALGAGLFLAIYFGALWLLGREGLGFGDVKLGAAAGLLLGWQRFLLAVLIASVLGSIVLLSLRLCRHDDKGREYPFAPFLAVGFATALLIGSQVISWYVGLLLY